MRLVGKQILRDFTKKQPDAQKHLDSLEAEIEEAQWENPHDLRKRYPKASILGDQTVIFNIFGNRYRLLVKIDYRNCIVLVQKIDTHKKYDKW